MTLKFPNEDQNFIERIKKYLEEFKLPSIDIPKLSIGFFDDFFESMDTKKVIGIAAFLVLIIVAVLSMTLLSPSGNIVQKGEKVKFKITEGMDAAEIARRLEKEGVIENALKFRILAKLNGYENQLKVGSYKFTTGMTYDEVFTKLLAGAPEVLTITIPEGFTVKDIAQKFSNFGVVNYDTFISKARTFAPFDYIVRKNNTFYDCEGFLFPDTYEVTTDMTSEDILYMMADNFDYRLSSTMRQRAAEEGLTVYELITLASIVEKEARYAEDRPIIAQVFFKRLEIGMPLQTDASLQYLMDAPKEDVSIADTQIDSPFNTYQNMGLPPGPIANPGLASIEAVLYPANTDYLYFVADRSGHNHYAYTYDEHLELVYQYR